MYYRYLFFVLAVTGLLTATGSAHAAQGSHNRNIALPYVCQGGANAGESCTPDAAECPRSACGIALVCEDGPKAGQSCTPDATECPGSSLCVLNSVGPEFTATLTVIVDDDVTKYNGTEDAVFDHVIAVTVFLETKYRGKTYFLSQTYQNLEGTDFASLVTALQAGPIIADTDRSRGNVTEGKLNDALDPVFIDGDPTKSILDDVFLQTPDNEMADELRRIFGVAGKPVVVDTPKKLKFVEHFDHEADGLASVVRLQVNFRFVLEP